jgi:hypothetical protein
MNERRTDFKRVLFFFRCSLLVGGLAPCPLLVGGPPRLKRARFFNLRSRGPSFLASPKFFTSASRDLWLAPFLTSRHVPPGWYLFA